MAIPYIKIKPEDGRDIGIKPYPVLSSCHPRSFAITQLRIEDCRQLRIDADDGYDDYLKQVFLERRHQRFRLLYTIFTIVDATFMYF